MKDNKDLADLLSSINKIKKEYNNPYYSSNSYYPEQDELPEYHWSDKIDYKKNAYNNYSQYSTDSDINPYAKGSLEYGIYVLYGEIYHDLMREFPIFLRKEFGSDKCNHVIMCLFGEDGHYPVTIREAIGELKLQMIKSRRGSKQYENILYIYDIIFGSPIKADKKISKPISKTEEINKKFMKLKEELSKL